MSLRHCLVALGILLVTTPAPALRAQDPASALTSQRPTRELVEQIVRETVQETNARVVTVGSWVSGAKYQDPLKGGTSDHDMRLIAPQGASPEAAEEAWRATRERIASKVRARFPDKATADKVLSSINLYPPDEVLEGIDDATEALTKLKNSGINPNLGGAQAEGLWGKGAKAFRDAYEAKSGRMIYKEGNAVRSGFADLLPLGETRGIYTIEGSANTATQFIEKILEAGKGGDARTLYKQLDRLNMALQKGRSLSGLQQRNYFDDILAQLKPLEKDPEALLAYFKAHSAELSEQISQGLKMAEPDAQLLKQFAKASNPRDVKILGEMLEEGTGKWARLKSSLSEASSHVPWGTLMRGLMAFFVYLETADISTTAGRGDAEQALQKILSNLGFAASLPAGILATMVTSILEDAKEAGYAMVTRFQDCEDLIAGIYEVKGREDVPDVQKIETNIDELARAFTTTEQIRGVVALHARNASQRNAGQVTARVDEAVEAALNARCDPIIITKWQRRRAEIIGEAAEQLMRAEGLFRAAYLTATATPEPVLLSPDGGLHGDVVVQAQLGADPAELTHALATYTDALKSLGGSSHEVAVSIEPSYTWMLDGRQINTDARLWVGNGWVFDAEAARRTYQLTSVGEHVVSFQYTLEISVISTIDDVFSAKRFLQKTFTSHATVTLSAIEDTRQPAEAAPDPAKELPPVTQPTPPPTTPPARTPPPAAPPTAGGAPAAPAGELSSVAAGGYYTLSDVKDTRVGCNEPPSSYSVHSNCMLDVTGSTVRTSAVVASRPRPGINSENSERTVSSSGSWTEPPKTLALETRVRTTISAAGGEKYDAYYGPLLGQALAVTEFDEGMAAGTGDQVAKQGQTKTYEWYFRDQVVRHDTYTIMVSHAGPGGSFSRTYTYTWTSGPRPSAATSVEAKAFTATILASGGSLRVPLGQSMSFTAQVRSQDGTAPPSDLVYRWQPNPEATFTPVEGPSRQAAAVFTRPGRVKVWVDVLQPSGGALSTVAESNQLDIEVVAPTLTLRASPAEPYPGQEVRVTMTVAPAAAQDLLNFRWEHAGAAISPGPLPGLREFTYTAKDVSPVTATVFAKSRDGGDDAGTAKITVTARPYRVTVTGPALMGPAPQQWDPKAGGLANVARQFLVFQQASMRATLAPEPPNTPRFAWTVTPDGCTLSNPISQEPTISCSQPGSFTVSVSATDANGAVLGSGSQSVSVAPQPAAAAPPPPTAPAPPVVTTPTPAERQQIAGRLRAEAKAVQDQGRLREAIAKYRESLTYVPDPALEAYITQVEAAAARQEAAAPAPADTANRERAAALRAEGKTLQDRGQLRDAIAAYRESLKYVPDPALEAYITQLETAAARQEQAARQAKLDADKKAAALATQQAEAAARDKAAEQAAAQASQDEQDKAQAAQREQQAKATAAAKAKEEAQAKPQAPPPAKPTPPPAEEGCQVQGTFEFDSGEGAMSMTLRQSGEQLDGTITMSAPGMDAARTSVRGSISRSSIRLTATTPEGDLPFTGTASSDCRTIRVTWTMDGDTHNFTLVKKQEAP